MKRILYVLAVVALSGCNPKKENKEHINSEPISSKISDTCKTLDDYRVLTNMEDKIKWLRDHGREVCQDILNVAAEDAHFLQFVPVRVSNVTMTKTWGEIKGMMGTDVYENYIRVIKNPTNHDILSIKKQSSYDQNSFCFSMPLFRGINKKYSLNDNDVFEFQSVKIDNTIVVAFTIIRQGNNVPLSYYDYSDKPDKKENTSTDEKSPL